MAMFFINNLGIGEKKFIKNFGSSPKKTVMVKIVIYEEKNVYL